MDKELILSDYLLSIDLYSITLLSLKRRSCAKINFEFMKTPQPVMATNYSKCQMRLRQVKPQTERHKQNARQTLSQHDKSHKSVIITTLCSQLAGFGKSESYFGGYLKCNPKIDVKPKYLAEVWCRGKLSWGCVVTRSTAL